MQLLPSFGTAPVKKVIGAFLERVGLLSGSAGGISRCVTPDEIDAIARKLAGPGSLPVREIVSHLHRLSTHPGHKLYLHIVRRALPYSVVLDPTQEPRLSLGFGRDLSVRSGSLPEEGPATWVLWVHSGGSESEFRVQCPASLGHATIVASQRLLCEARPVVLSGGAVSWPVEAA